MSKKVRILLVSMVVLFVFAATVAHGATTFVFQDYAAAEWLEIRDDLLTRYMAQNPDVKFELNRVLFGEYSKKLLLQVMTNTLPDIARFDGTDTPTLIAGGAFREITPWVEEWGKWDDFIPGARAACTMNDKIYGLQYETDNIALWYNIDDVFDAGLPGPPRTWDELVSYAQKMTTPDRYGFAWAAIAHEACTWMYQAFLWANGGSLLALDQPEALETLELWVELVEKGAASQDVVNWDQGQIAVEFRAHRASMLIEGNWELPKTKASDIRFGITTVPTPKREIQSIVAMGGHGLAIGDNVSDEKAKAAWDFIRWRAEPEQMIEQLRRQFKLSVRYSLMDEVATMDPLLAPFLYQAQRSRWRPGYGGLDKYSGISGIVWVELQNAIVGKKSAKDALEAAARKIEEIMKK